MRRITSLSGCVLIFLAACGSPEEQGTGAEQETTPESTEAALPDPLLTIYVGLSQDSVTVSPDSVEIHRATGPFPHIAWAADTVNPGSHWIVGFGQNTPLDPPLGGDLRNVFSSDQGRNRGRISGLAGTYKYWVFVSNDEGRWFPEDPKIVIIDDGGADSSYVGGGGN